MNPALVRLGDDVIYQGGVWSVWDYAPKGFWLVDGNVAVQVDASEFELPVEQAGLFE